ncbi:hypothetical protein N9C31_02565 [Gammaproteobacteria bacterium]|nr:hypothetical protein [Gammaproteobacteria bacterium]
MKNQSYYELLASVLMISPSQPTADHDFNIFFDTRSQCSPNASTPQEVLLALNHQFNQPETDSLTHPLNHWLMGHSIKMGLAHIPTAFTDSNLNLPGTLAQNFNSITWPSLSPTHRRVLEQNAVFSLTFTLNSNHWVTLVIQPNKQRVIFFDPYGRKTAHPLTIQAIIDQGLAKFEQYQKAHSSETTEKLRETRGQLETICNQNNFGLLSTINQSGYLPNFQNYTLINTLSRYQHDQLSCGQWNIIFLDFIHHQHPYSQEMTCDAQFDAHLSEKKRPINDIGIQDMAMEKMHDNLKAIIKKRGIQLPNVSFKSPTSHTNRSMKLLILFMALVTAYLYPSPIVIFSLCCVLLSSQLIAFIAQSPHLMSSHQFVTSGKIPPLITDQSHVLSHPQPGFDLTLGSTPPLGAH